MRIAIVLAGVVLMAVAAVVMFGGLPTPPADPFAFDPAAPGTDVPLASSPAAAEPPAPAAADPAPPEAAPVTPESAPAGVVSVQSTPAGALVTVDGRLAGTTPLTVSDVTPGVRVIQVARPGYVPVEERVDIVPGQPATVNVRLSRGTSAAAAPDAMGSLRVESRPAGATVRIDGRRAGVTPIAAVALAAGRHVIEFELTGYRSLRTEAVVRGGERTRVGVSLEPGDRGRRD